MTKEFSGQELADGIWPAVALSASYGSPDGPDGAPHVQINVQITEGADKGKRVTYEDKVNNRSALYIQRSCRSVGWRGVTLASLKADVEAWIADTGGVTSIEITHILIKNGKNAGKIWAKPRAIGKGAQVLRPLSQERISDADAAMRDAMIADGHEPPAWGDAPHAAGGGGSDDDIPFVSCDLAHEPSPIARVLR